MEIRIDTSKDSHDDIRKAISFLKRLVGDEGSDPGPSGFDMPSDAAMSIFGDDAPPPGSGDSKDKEAPGMSEDKVTVIPY